MLLMLTLAAVGMPGLATAVQEKASSFMETIVIIQNVIHHLSELCSHRDHHHHAACRHYHHPSSLRPRVNHFRIFAFTQVYVLILHMCHSNVLYVDLAVAAEIMAVLYVLRERSGFNVFICTLGDFYSFIHVQANPLGKVIELLDSLAAKITAEGEEELKAYKAYFEWCEDVTRNKQFEIKTATALKEKLEATISKAAGESEASATKIEELAAAIASGESDLKDATLIREKETAGCRIRTINGNRFLLLLVP